MKRTLSTLLAASLLAACGGDDSAETEAVPGEDADASAEESAPARPAVIARRPAPGSLSFVLLPWVDESVAAEAEVLPSGRSSAFTVRLSEGEPGARYEGSIRLGDCVSPGPTLASLGAATVDASGAAEARVDVPISMDSLVNTRMALVYVRAGRQAACSPIPQG